jgi:hypothetical protein
MSRISTESLSHVVRGYFREPTIASVTSWLIKSLRFDACIDWTRDCHLLRDLQRDLLQMYFSEAGLVV